MTQAGHHLIDARGASRRVTLRRSRAVRLASLAFALIGAAAVHFAASAHLGAVDSLWLAGAALAAQGLSYVRYERRQPSAIEVTVEGIAALDAKGCPLFQGRIVGFTHWSERLLVLAIGAADTSRRRTLVVCADSIDAAAFRALAVMGRHAAV